MKELHGILTLLEISLLVVLTVMQVLLGGKLLLILMGVLLLMVAVRLVAKIQQKSTEVPPTWHDGSPRM